MFSLDDTVVAIATPPGRGGIGVVRLSGPGVLDVIGGLIERRGGLEPRRATLTRIRGRHAESSTSIADEVVVTFFPAPHSYTGGDVVEVSAHGSPVVLQGIVSAAVSAGARLAQPGEFTLRAFLNGKVDLVQAEAVADLVDAVTPLQASVAFDQLDGSLTQRIAAIDEELLDLIVRLEASLDFPDEGYHFIDPIQIEGRLSHIVAALDGLLSAARAGRTIREGATVVVSGRPNVGKSSLFNALAGHDRAIVTDVAGTTRDLVTERVDIGGVAVTVVDTAGFRDTSDVVEREGVARGTQARQVADLVLVVLDQSEALTSEDERLLAETRGHRRIVIANKCDRERARGFGVMEALHVSATAGTGLAGLRMTIARELTGTELTRDTPAVSNLRHIRLLEGARGHLERAAVAAARDHLPEEFLLTDLQAARALFDEVVGVRTSEDVIRQIFSSFCIGK